MNAEKTLAEVGLIVKVDKRHRVLRKKRGKIPNNQKKDIIKDIRGLLRNQWNNLDDADLEKLNQIKQLLEQ
jgi:thymidylate synthase